MEALLRTLLPLTATGSILILIMLALKSVVGKRLSMTWQYYIWLLVLARLCIPWFPAVEGIPALLPAPETSIFSAVPAVT
ncbi:MAG: M56 family metallopeptidase, partial [Syntrophomonadaceae bacterium]|nr:M56 family metallopeptidase [Syntrophomonadaceae bacterium]